MKNYKTQDGKEARYLIEVAPELESKMTKILEENETEGKPINKRDSILIVNKYRTEPDFFKITDLHYRE